MKIKETIYTEIDDRGYVITSTRTVETVDSFTDRGYDYGTRYGAFGNPRRTSIDRIMEAYDDYRKSQQW